MTRRFFLLLCLLTAALVVTGCNDDDDNIGIFAETGADQQAPTDPGTAMATRRALRRRSS